MEEGGGQAARERDEGACRHMRCCLRPHLRSLRRLPARISNPLKTHFGIGGGCEEAILRFRETSVRGTIHCAPYPTTTSAPEEPSQSALSLSHALSPTVKDWSSLCADVEA